MKKILTCVGTRPNFIKVMLLEKLFTARSFRYELLHTGQHFDENMSDVFFRQLGLGEPDHYLGIGGGSHAEVVGRIIEKAAAVMTTIRPDLVIVPGDVNSTFACAFAAASLGIPVAHIESGLRSFDMTMPEERNRILTDRLSSLLFVTEPAGVENLQREGIAANNAKLVGNTIIDALIAMLALVNKSTIREDLGLKRDYILLTFHRPVNVDEPEALKKIVEIVKRLSEIGTCVFPMHPRTRTRIEANGWMNELQAVGAKANTLRQAQGDSTAAILLSEPLGYIEFLALMKNAACLVSDSGGVQVECSYLGVPLVTVREATECILTIERGTNTLCPLDPQRVVELVRSKMDSAHSINPLDGIWDGRASERIADEVARFLS